MVEEEEPECDRAGWAVGFGHDLAGVLDVRIEALRFRFGGFWGAGSSYGFRILWNLRALGYFGYKLGLLLTKLFIWHMRKANSVSCCQGLEGLGV